MRVLLALIIVLGFSASVASAQTYNPTYNYSYQKLTTSTYVYEYPKVDYLVVPAYPLVQAANQAILPPAMPTMTATVPTGLDPVATTGPIQAIAYVQPAACYSVVLVPVYRTRYVYQK